MTLAHFARVEVDPRSVLSSKAGHDLAHRLVRARLKAVRATARSRRQAPRR